MRPKWQKLNREDRIEAIKDGVSRKLSASKIAEELGCTKNSIIGLANRCHIQLASTGHKRSPKPKKRDWTKLNVDEKAEFIRMNFANGKSVGEIVDLLHNVTAKAIQRCAERNGISRRITKPPVPSEPSKVKRLPNLERPIRPHSGPINIMDILSGECRGPMWADEPGLMKSPEDWNFCGKPTKPGSSFCPECHKRFWMQPERPLRYSRRDMNAGYK